MAKSAVDKHSIVLCLILLACLFRYMFSYTTTQQQAQSVPPGVRGVIEEEERRLEKLKEVTLEIGSAPIEPPQQHLSDILKNMPPNLPWYEFGQSVVKQARERFLDDLPPPPDSTVTLVSAVLNVHPLTLELPMADLNTLVNTFMRYPQKKIVFIDETFMDEFSKHIDANTKVVIVNVEKLRSYFGPALDDMQRIIDNPNWRFQVDWLSGAPQAEFPEYNMAYISQVFLLREAARLNPWGTRSFMWFDPALSCVSPPLLTSDKMGVFNEHFDRFFLSFFLYNAERETHGFPKHTYEHFIGVQNQPHRVVKGWAFGGQLGSIELVAVLVDLVMRETLRQGQMGNADCILSIVMERFPDAIHPFNSASACATSTSYDRECKGYSNPHYWCSPFDWAVNGPPA